MNLKDYNLGIFEFVPGRYYAAMWFLNFPKGVSEFGQGGDLTALLWRPDGTPTEWVLQWRFRHYRDEQVWESKDSRHWYAGKHEGDEQSCRAKVQRFLSEIAGVAGSKLEVLEICGGVDAYSRAFFREKPYWLHRGIGDDLAAKGGQPAGN